MTLKQMTLAKYKKNQKCSDWSDIENLSFLLFWPWPVTLVLNLDLDVMMTYFHTHNKVSGSIGLKFISYKQKFLVFLLQVVRHHKLQ